MPYKFSRCISFQTPNRDEAVKFYNEVLGLKIVDAQANCIELQAEQNRLFVETADAPLPVHELIVPDLEAAREELIANGCEIVRWEGKGRDCYIRDPFGFMFNVWEEPQVFSK